MLVGKLNLLLGTLNRLKAETSPEKTGKELLNLNADRVDISEDARQKITVETAQKVMAQFKSALIETISVKGGGPLDSLYDLTGAPLDVFIRDRFARLDADAKKGFMEEFSKLSKTSAGLLPATLIRDTFGTAGGFPQMIEQISKSLNRYL
jgi:hypothetical protein